ncbi:MAG: TatD family hydrolase [Dehalococcoidales bacterium]|nr:TatD family hydrolase [Dehalococcoidales bacterium]
MNDTDIYIVDTHAHLDMSAFNKDRIDVLNRARDACVKKIITIGINMESSLKAIELAKKHPEILATIGIHPHDATEAEKIDTAKFTEIANHPRVVAIGEIGLDFYRDYSPRELQLQTLKLQLELSVKLELPVIIHCRQAESEMLKLLHDWISLNPKTQKQSPGVIHCFNGGKDALKQYLNMGFYISLGAYIGYPKSKMQEIIQDIPDDRLVVETDCPFLPPQSHRGKRNEPAYIPFTIELLSKIRNESYEQIAKITTENAYRLFRIKDEM